MPKSSDWDPPEEIEASREVGVNYESSGYEPNIINIILLHLILYMGIAYL